MEASKICLFAMLIALINARNPPDHTKVALMARYIMHNSDWISLATISSQKNILGYPFAALKSVSDGSLKNSTGIPFLYMTNMDVSGKDVLVDQRVSLMASLAELDYCRTNNYDPQDPRCAKLLITGRIIKVHKDSSEYEFGQEALFQRHPEMKFWPQNHEFYVAKVEIKQIQVLDYFGGIKLVSLVDYLQADPTFLKLKQTIKVKLV